MRNKKLDGMSVKKQLVLSLLVALLGLAAPGAGWAEEPPKELDGLHLVHDSATRRVYTRPGVDFKRYDKAILLEVFVSFQKNWQQEHNATDPFLINKQGVLEIKQRVGGEFMKRFAYVLEKRGIGVVGKDSAAEDVLIVRPAIVNLEVTSPDSLQQDEQGQTFVASAGQMSLFAELYDSVSSQLIARILSAGVDEGFGGFMPANRVTNKAAEDRIVDRWANQLADHMGKLGGN